MTQYKPNIVFYHSPCSDGITAAAVVANFYSIPDKTSSKSDNDVVYFKPWNYAKPYPIAELIDSCRGKNILFVDCSAKLDVIEKIAQSAKSILLIDHHITAKQQLSQYIQDASITDIEKKLEEDNIIMVYDVNHSGASLTYKFFHPGQNIPEYIKYIENIDLGKEDLPKASYFKYWERANKLDLGIARHNIRIFTTIGMMDDIFRSGKEIERYVTTTITNLLKESRVGYFGNEPFRYVFGIYALCSDAARMLLNEEYGGYKFSIAFYFTANGLGASIRSVEGFDCSVIAKEFGGGGHAQASGFNIPWVGLDEFLTKFADAGTELFPS